MEDISPIVHDEIIDFLISSILMGQEYKRGLPDYSLRIQRPQ
jgi:hypothetical protein